MSSSAESSIARHEGYLEADPDNPFLLTALGDVYHRSGRFDEALACFAKCLSLQPRPAVPLGRIAGVMLSKHRFADAETLLRRLCEANPRNGALHHDLGLALFYQRRWRDALAAFDCAQREGLDGGDTRRYRTYVLHHLGLVNEAIESCRAWLQRDAAGAANGYLAVLEMDKGDLPGAYRRACEILRADARNADAALVAGMYLTEQQDIAGAREQFDRLLALEPDNSRAWFGIGLTHLYREEHAAAIEALEKALAADPAHLGALVTLGWSRFANRDLPGAEQVFRQAVAVNRTFGEAHGGLAVTLVFQNRRQEARRHAVIARRLDRHGFGALWARAGLLALDGKREQGEAEVAAALERRVTSDGRTLFEHLQFFLRTQAARSGTAKLPAPPETPALRGHER